MKLEWEQRGLTTLHQAKGELGEFKINTGPYGVQLYFETQYLGKWFTQGDWDKAWYTKDDKLADMAIAKARAQMYENSGETKEWI